MLAAKSSLPGKSAFTWIIDQLDETLNFPQGIPHFAVSVSIKRGIHPEHDVIVDPVNGEDSAHKPGGSVDVCHIVSARTLSNALIETTNNIIRSKINATQSRNKRYISDRKLRPSTVVLD